MSAYRPRAFAFHGVHEAGGAALKTYTIAADGRAPAALALMLAHARASMPAAGFPPPGSLGAGYLIHHAGKVADWLLMRVWVEGGIVAGLLAADRGAGLAPVSEPFIECVWESVVTGHERDAWVRARLGEARDAYLADRLADGRY